MAILNDNVQPLISVIATCYNHEKFVVKCLDSIKNQTYRNYELIIIDAKSSDKSLEIIESWLDTSELEFTFLKQPKTYGICKNINDGLKIARGQFVQVIATDDYLDKNKFKNYLEKFLLFESQNKDVALIFSAIGKINEAGDVFEYKDSILPFDRTNSFFESLTENNFIYAPSVMMSKRHIEQIGGYDESLHYNDWDMWLRLSLNSDFYFYENYVSAYYRKIKTSMTYNKPIGFYISTFKLFHKLYKVDKNNEQIINQLHRAISNWGYVKGRIRGRLTLIFNYVFPTLSIHTFNYFVASRYSRD